jgi:hypothetical protein
MNTKYDLFPKHFDKRFELSVNQNTLVIGIGGGSDVIGAFGIASILKSKSPKCNIDYALCVSEKENYNGFEQINRFLHKRTEKSINSEQKQSHSLILVRKMSEFDKHLSNPYLISRPKPSNQNQNEITNAINLALLQIRPTNIIAVDLGGDSLTCGVDGNEFGFDRTGIKALQEIGIPFIYLVLGLGCDGESTIEMLQNSIEREVEQNSVLGSFRLDKIIEQMSPLSKKLLKDNRTPNIIVDAYEQIRINEQKLFDLTLINRHRKPRIPNEWLISGVAFDGLKFSGKCQ